MRTIYTDGVVFTGDMPLQQAFIVEDGRFAAVGSTEEMRALAQPGDREMPLNGRFVCAGFNDSHMHLLNYGNVMTQCVLSGATGSLSQLQQELWAYLSRRQLPDGAWLLGRGWNQDYFVPATGMPTRQDLDAVTQTHPVCIVRCCGHCLVVNSRALSLLQLDEATPCPPGGAMDRDAQGRLTGVFRDAAMSLVLNKLPVPTHAQICDMLRTACQRLNAVGVTSCQTDDFCSLPGVSWQDVTAAYQELDRAGEMTVRVYEQCQFQTAAELQAFLDAGGRSIAGSSRFRLGPLKLLGDGSLGARTAFLSGSYADAPDERGIAIFTQAELDEMISLAHASGMQCAVHAIGDGILDRVLDAYEKAFSAHPRSDHRSGVVHLQLTRPDQLARMASLGLHAYVQSVFLDYDSHIVHQRAGEQLASTSYALRSLAEMGIHASNGTDCPVESPEPMRGVQCAVTRQPLDASLAPYRPEEAVSVADALRSYTVEGAYASFEEGFKGRIAPGMAADFAVLSGDPFHTPAGEISRISALMTFVDGVCVYAAE